MRRARGADLGILVAYLAVSFLYFGWRLLPHPGRLLVGTNGWLDPQTAVWFFAWWPHAILHGTNPFVSHALDTPAGLNVAASNGIPGLALLFSPLTLIAGASVSYNVASIAAPALSAFAAFLLFRSLTRSTLAAAVGGYLFGFSSFALAHTLGGHVCFTAGFVVPLIALLLLRFVRGEVGARALMLGFGALLAVQAYIAIEIATTAGIVLVVGLALAYLVIPQGRSRIAAALRPLGAGALLAGVLAAPLLYYDLTVFSTQPTENASYSADLLNLVVPTSVIALGSRISASVVANFPGETNERDSYVGLASLLIVALLLLRRPWSAAVRLCVVVLVVATVFSLGPTLIVDGHHVVGLPTGPLFRLPILRELLPSRIALYGSLAVAALVAIWLAQSERLWWYWRAWRLVLAAVAVASLVPPFWTTMFVQNPPRLAFFSDGRYASCFPPDETLLVFPFIWWSSSDLWQAEASFSFKLVGSTFGPTPASYKNDPVMAQLYNKVTPSAPTQAQLLALARRWHVQRVVAATSLQATFPLTTVPVGAIYPSASMMRVFGPVQRVGDVLVAPPCGDPPLGSP